MIAINARKSATFMDLSQMVAVEERKKKKQTKARTGTKQKSPKKNKKYKTKNRVTATFPSTPVGVVSEVASNTHERVERMKGGRFIDSV